MPLEYVHKMFVFWLPVPPLFLPLFLGFSSQGFVFLLCLLSVYSLPNSVFSSLLNFVPIYSISIFLYKWLDEQSSGRQGNSRDSECTFDDMSKYRLIVEGGGEKLPYLVFPVLYLAGLFLIYVWRGLYCCIHAQKNWERSLRGQERQKRRV